MLKSLNGSELTATVSLDGDLLGSPTVTSRCSGHLSIQPLLIWTGSLGCRVEADAETIRRFPGGCHGQRRSLIGGITSLGRGAYRSRSCIPLPDRGLWTA
jgi:hypothetical protein